jgi:hypothetical protein
MRQMGKLDRLGGVDVGIIHDGLLMQIKNGL